MGSDNLYYGWAGTVGHRQTVPSPRVRIPEEQKRRLDERKVIDEESYGSVIKRLLDEIEECDADG